MGHSRLVKICSQLCSDSPKKWGRLPPPPKDNPAPMPAGWRNGKGTPYSLALNSIWNLRGSLYDAVKGTPTAADRLLRPDT